MMQITVDINSSILDEKDWKILDYYVQETYGRESMLADLWFAKFEDVANFLILNGYTTEEDLENDLIRLYL